MNLITYTVLLAFVVKNCHYGKIFVYFVDFLPLRVSK